MNSNRINEELQRDIDRYVLNDETLDRGAFESRMIENEQIAWAVANTVADLEKISAVCRSEPAVESASVTSATLASATNRVGGNWSVVLATLASVVLLAVLSQFAWERSDSFVAQVATERPQLTQLAENWIAMTENEGGTEDELLTTTVSEQDRVDGEDWGDSSDWMLEAAQQFFQELES